LSRHNVDLSDVISRFIASQQQKRSTDSGRNWPIGSTVPSCGICLH